MTGSSGAVNDWIIWRFLPCEARCDTRKTRNACSQEEREVGSLGVAEWRLRGQVAPRFRYKGWNGFARGFGRLGFAALVAGGPRRLRRAAAPAELARPRHLRGPLPRGARRGDPLAARLRVAGPPGRPALRGRFYSPLSPV